MKIKKLERIHKGKYPIIRVYYNNWFNHNRIKDVTKSSAGSWVYLESGNFVIKNTHALDTFCDIDVDSYLINKDNI